MLSNTKCKQILNRNGIHYTDEEVILIKDFLYKIAAIIHDSFTQEEMRKLKKTFERIRKKNKKKRKFKNTVSCFFGIF